MKLPEKAVSGIYKNNADVIVRMQRHRLVAVVRSQEFRRSLQNGLRSLRRRYLVRRDHLHGSRRSRCHRKAGAAK